MKYKISICSIFDNNFDDVYLIGSLNISDVETFNVFASRQIGSILFEPTSISMHEHGVLEATDSIYSQIKTHPNGKELILITNNMDHIKFFKNDTSKNLEFYTNTLKKLKDA